mgnify:CR=1 FL=1
MPNLQSFTNNCDALKQVIIFPPETHTHTYILIATIVQDSRGISSIKLVYSIACILAALLVELHVQMENVYACTTSSHFFF